MGNFCSTKEAKIKQFMWLLAHNSLPLKMNIKLYAMGIECNILCVYCKRLDENRAHLFLKCTVRQVWTLIGLNHVHDCMCAYGTAESVILEILALEDKEKILTYCTLW
jgi:hypothetical protein